ncbi:MAG: GNAT family N-acetyltransferase [Nocardioides sp.]|nr:GNAT family N-acetyltransferase [Nocardioides sp.]
MTALTPPSGDRFDAWADCVRDFDGVGLAGSGSWQVQGFGPTRESFETLLEHTRAESDTGRDLQDGHVHCDYFWVTDPDEVVVGFLAMRHSIDTDFLRTQGGHIGYSIRPSHRRQGHAARALGLALNHARMLGLGHVLLTCDEDNVGSIRTIESQGGDFERILIGKRRYWIDL